MRLFDRIWVHYEMLAFKEFVMLDFPTLKSLLFSFFVKYDEGYRKNEWGFHFGSFLCYDGFPVDDSIFFCQLKLIIILCQTKKGERRLLLLLLLLPLAAGWLFSGSNRDDLATLQKTRMSRAEKMVIFSTHFPAKRIFCFSTNTSLVKAIKSQK